ncbi:MAG: O-antigen ligase family protein [Flavobacteriales bacterium]|nr:O-antigen ligase family protein [Flavobacteriales bacterium]
MGIAITNYIEKSRTSLVMLLVLLLPISKQFVPLVIILLVVSWLASPNLLERLKGALTKKYMWLFISFYVMHLIGMLYTDNIAVGSYDLEIKLSFLLFPFMFASFPAISRDKYYNIGLAFVLGCAIAGLADLGMGFINYAASDDIKDLLYGRLSFFHHPSYFAMYLAFGLAIMLHGLIIGSDELPLSNKRLYLILIPFFMGMTILLMAKSGILSMGMVLLITLVFLLVKRRFLAFGGLSLALTVAIVGSLWLAPGVFNRIKTTWDVVLQPQANIESSTVESTAGRMLVWNRALELIQENFILGVGTGDIKEELVQKYAEAGLSGIEGKQLNAHNQFIQSFATLGILGFLSLVLGLLLAGIMAIRKGNIVYLMFIIIVTVNALTESILEVQAGVIFYAFFNALFMFLEPD